MKFIRLNYDNFDKRYWIALSKNGDSWNGIKDCETLEEAIIICTGFILAGYKTMNWEINSNDSAV